MKLTIKFLKKQVFFFNNGVNISMEKYLKLMITPILEKLCKSVSLHVDVVSQHLQGLDLIIVTVNGERILLLDRPKYLKHVNDQKYIEDYCLQVYEAIPTKPTS